MKELSFMNANNSEIHLSDVYFLHQSWTALKKFSYLNESRQYQGLLYVKKGTLKYEIVENNSKRIIFANQGDTIYIPKGSRYIVYFTESAEDILLNFNATDENNENISFKEGFSVILNNKSEYFADTFYLASQEYLNRISSMRNIMKSYAYKVFDSIALCLLESEQTPLGKSLIKEATAYMKNHPTEKFSINALAKISNVSDRYFRTIFKKYTGITPSEYKMNILIEYSKKLLSENAMNVTEVSDYLGFCDSSYFSKVFKKSVGISPKEFQRAKQ